MREFSPTIRKLSNICVCASLDDAFLLLDAEQLERLGPIVAEDPAAGRLARRWLELNGPFSTRTRASQNPFRADPTAVVRSNGLR